MDARRARARELARESLSRGDPVGWFEELYSGANGDERAIQWADMAPNPHLVAWLRRGNRRGEGQRALVVGCGLGDDAEELARLGYAVVAFDVSATAIAWCRRRFPGSSVDYQIADVLALPASWDRAFDLVVESYTLQVLPSEPRRRAIEAIRRCVAPGGVALVIARGRDPEDDPGQMPWPLTRSELGSFAQGGLSEVAFEDYFDGEQPPVRRFRVEYRFE